MKLCTQIGNGICINCGGVPKDKTQTCRINAEEQLDMLVALLGTKLTQEQLDVIADFMPVHS